MSSLLKRWWWILLAVPVAIGLWRLRIDVEMLNLLPPDQPAVQGLKLYQQHFANARELIITIRAPEPEKAERLAGALAARLREETNLIAGVSWQPPWMEQPAQAAELVACLWLNQPPEAFGALTNRLARDHLQAVLADTKEALTTSLSPMDLVRRAFDPYDLLSVPALASFSGISAEQGQKVFASSDGTFRVLFVQARPDLTSYRACSSWLKAVQQTVAGLSAGQGDWGNVVVRYTGRPAFVTEIASSMQRDLSGSIVGTAIIIALLFWLSHRRWLPMFWLLALLAGILVATVGIGGLVLGSISVISLGFAAVLLGLAVDYAVVHYQEALAHPRMSVPEIRRAISPSILWAAITTISAFLVLNLGGLPGLAQLGLLVAIGIALAALVMVVAFLPPLFPERRSPGMALARHDWWSYLIPPGEQTTHTLIPAEGSHTRAAFLVTGLIILCACAVLTVNRPGLDKTTAALRPQHGEAEKALEEVTASLGISQDSTWVIVSGSDEREVYQRLSAAEALLNQARSNQVISGYLLPTALWPRVEFQDANRGTARFLGTQGPLLREAALRAGFNTNALFLTEELVRTWARVGASPGVIWPTNQVSQWLLKQFVARSTNAWLVMGLVYPATNRLEAVSLADLSARLSEHGVLLSGWELLGTTTLKRVQERLWLLVLPIILLILTSLWLAFRRPTEVLLGMAVLCLSGLCLLATMALSGWSWNLLNLMALPLVLGTGVDYGIFMQLALRRNGGAVRLVRRSVGRALLLCGGTAIAGFGSLAWSGNAGMASLGKVCAVGIAANMLISVYLLPAWWAHLSSKAKSRKPKAEDGQARLRSAADQSSVTQCAPGKSPPAHSPSSSPTSFYRAGVWRLGLTLARVVPKPMLDRLFVLCAEIYYRSRRRRRETVISNLLPVLLGDRAAAETKAHALFRQFALKLADLWRYEAGDLAQDWSLDPDTWERFLAWQARGRGILLVLPHLGNWEIGAPLLARRGVQLLVLTQAEPASGLTELRMASRAKWGIETLVVGNDNFAFVEVIKRLQEGATVALLIDRPTAPTAVRVELFGRPFLASIAAAELARASGCVLARASVLRMGDSYTARIHPAIEYDRQALGSREARRQLTQQILRAFEPEIREHVDQWFHFVPIWPEYP